jgi:phosphate starvation-inducible PhoH-like protein
VEPLQLKPQQNDLPPESIPINQPTAAVDLSLQPEDNARLANFSGQFDENLLYLEAQLDIEIHHRGHQFHLVGEQQDVMLAQQVLVALYEQAANKQISKEDAHLLLKQTESENRHDEAGESPAQGDTPDLTVINTRYGKVRARGKNQHRYLYNIQHYDVNFGIGPAGTGKTYLAVACAVDALEHDEVRRIILARPAVEAGERLGFLPGDLSQKVDPYLRPLYDALFEMMGVEKVTRLIERNTIEIAPLAYMRGRTLNDSFIILDEAQNTTVEQMKMFLTRIGFGSTAVITGDITQIDLPREQQSGLRHIIPVLKDVEDISFTHFKSHDVVRHPLVQRIVDAYERHDRRDNDDD